MEKWKSDHLQRFASLRTSNRLARDIKESVSVVLEWLRCNGMAKEVPHSYFTDKIKRFKPVEPIKRHPAVYDNPSHEEIINKYLNVKHETNSGDVISKRSGEGFA